MGSHISLYAKHKSEDIEIDISNGFGRTNRILKNYLSGIEGECKTDCWGSHKLSKDSWDKFMVDWVRLYSLELKIEEMMRVEDLKLDEEGLMNEYFSDYSFFEQVQKEREIASQPLLNRLNAMGYKETVETLKYCSEEYNGIRDIFQALGIINGLLSIDEWDIIVCIG